MKLRQFRVRAFRCIHDTGVVPVSDTAALIGKNESGKTAILAALAHLNRDKPIDAQDICDDLVDSVTPEDRIVEGLFELTPAELDIVSKELPEVTNLTHVRIFRKKSPSAIEYEFPGAQFPKKFSINGRGKPGFLNSVTGLSAKVHEAIGRAFVAEPDPKVRTANANALKARFDEIFKAIRTDSFEYRGIDSLLSRLGSLITEHFKTDKSVVGSLGIMRKMFQGAFFLSDRQPKTKQFMRDKLHPRLIYFPEYKVIDGIIDIKQYLLPQDIPQKRSDIGYQFQKAETIRNLFHLAELDPAKLETMADNQSQLNSQLVRSSQRLTKMLALTWRAKKIGVRLNYSSGTVTVIVSDNFADGTTKNEGLLDRRSAGFKWHFSFYVNFRAGVQQNTFKDAILLLDEPGLNLHPEQQAGLVDVIRDLSQTNQVLYTTHSPFMIYNFDRGALLIIEFDPESKASRIQQSFWDGDWQTIRPVLHSIGDSMLLKVFTGGADVLSAILAVEGISDQRYLVALAQLDVGENEDSKLGGAEPLPSGGHTLVRERALYYHKRKKKVAALFDNEPDAIAEADKLEKRFPKEAIVRINIGKAEADIEDMFTREDYLNAVNGFYSHKLRDAKNFTGITKREIEAAIKESDSPRIVKALEMIFLSHAADGWGGYDKLGVCNFLCDAIANGQLKLSIKTKERFDDLFSTIRAAVEYSGTAKKKSKADKQSR